MVHNYWPAKMLKGGESLFFDEIRARRTQNFGEITVLQSTYRKAPKVALYLLEIPQFFRVARDKIHSKHGCFSALLSLHSHELIEELGCRFTDIKSADRDDFNK